MLYFDIARFRALYKEFSNVTTYPDAVLNIYWDNANLYIHNSYIGDDKLQYLLSLMTAHLLKKTATLSSGSSGAVTSTSIDAVSVTVQAPPKGDQYSYWLNSTAYGSELLAMLDVYSQSIQYVTARNGGTAGFRQ